jgi:hypothetical protein
MTCFQPGWDERERYKEIDKEREIQIDDGNENDDNNATVSSMN